MTSTIGTLPVLVLYPHSRCNCRCVMCDIWKDTTQAELSSAELVAHLEDMVRLRVRWVVFSGGEPLMHSDLFRLADMLRSRGIRVTILSTGLLLKKHAAQIATRVDDLIVSLDGPPAVHDRVRRVAGAGDLLKEGVREVLAANPAFPIAARCTVQRSNHRHLMEATQFARDLGLRSISFLAADLTSPAFNRIETWSPDRQTQVALTREETVALADEFDMLHKRWEGTGFILESTEKLHRIVRHFRAHLGDCEPEAPLCNAPWVSAVVEVDGTVRPCFFHRSIGSLRTESLISVLNGFEAQTFRSSLNVATNPVCKRCVCSLNLPMPV